MGYPIERGNSKPTIKNLDSILTSLRSGNSKPTENKLAISLANVSLKIKVKFIEPSNIYRNPWGPLPSARFIGGPSDARQAWESDNYCPWTSKTAPNIDVTQQSHLIVLPKPLKHTSAIVEASSSQLTSKSPFQPKNSHLEPKISLRWPNWTKKKIKVKSYRKITPSPYQKKKLI